MRVCWNRQTGTFEGRVSLTYGFKSHYSHQSSELKRLAAFLFIAVFTCYALLLYHCAWLFGNFYHKTKGNAE